jgi:hypothetical protein
VDDGVSSNSRPWIYTDNAQSYLLSYQTINNGDMEVSKIPDMKTTFIRLFTANCNS